MFCRTIRGHQRKSFSLGSLRRPAVYRKAYPPQRETSASTIVSSAGATARCTERATQSVLAKASGTHIQQTAHQTTEEGGVMKDSEADTHRIVPTQWPKHLEQVTTPLTVNSGEEACSHPNRHNFVEKLLRLSDAAEEARPREHRAIPLSEPRDQQLLVRQMRTHTPQRSITLVDKQETLPKEIVHVEGEDDDVCVEMPPQWRVDRTPVSSDLLTEANEAQENMLVHPSARGVSQDVIDLVTDAFKAQRVQEVARRRQAMYDLTHPNPSDYTYKGKLVPPPPLNFGRVTEDATRLGNQIMLDQTYTLVKQASMRATDNQQNAEVHHSAIEVDVNRNRPRTSVTRVSHRGRKREHNIYRDHNYFFEVNELYQEIVIVGKANAGKSSLLNALLGQSVAKTSSTAHTTRCVSFYQSVSPEELAAFHKKEHHNLIKLPGRGLQLTFVDVPGFGIEGMSDKWRDSAIELTDAYLGVRRSVNTVFFCIDCERGLTKSDIKYFTWLENLHGVFFVVLTKCDSVPHSRICSVMRQVYVLTTKHRRQFRKVFPFIIPTSSRDGTNIEMLRGLIAETSGMIPGDRLRRLLQRKQESMMHQALLGETHRLEEIRDTDRAQARALFTKATGYHDLQMLSDPKPSGFCLPTTDADTHGRFGDQKSCALKTEDLSSSVEKTRAVTDQAADSRDGVAKAVGVSPAKSVTYCVELDLSADGEQRQIDGEVPRGDACGDSNPKQGQFLRWRQLNPLERFGTPYGPVRYRINSGLDNPNACTVTLTYGGEEQGSKSSPPPVSEADRPTASPLALNRGNRSAVLGVPSSTESASEPAASLAQSGNGPVSAFLNTLQAYEHQTHHLRGRRGAIAKETKWRQRYSPCFLAQDEEGRLVEFKGGKRCGPSLVTATTSIAERKAAWKAYQLKEALVAENPLAPWNALGELSKKVEQAKQNAAMKGMRKKELAAYLRNAGRITESFQKFEGEVTVSKYMNEVRQTTTLRSQEQMHLNATSKINYRSMPPGLWKRYGEKETYWPTPRVMGREADESHTSGR